MPVSARRTAIAAILLAGAAFAPSALAAAPAIDERAVRASEADEELRVVGLLRARVGYPQRVSAGVGALWARLPRVYDCTTTCRYDGITLQLEPGLGGAQLSAGWATLVGEKRRNERFLSDVLLGFGLRGALLRTWDDSASGLSSRTLAGAEAGFTVIRLSFSVGVFRALDGDAAGERWLVGGGFGWGF